MLPQELIDRIIECDKDNVTALRKYSLVCRSWTVSSQRQLFSSMCLETGRTRPHHDSETFLVSGPFRSFLAVAQRSPHILHYTRRIGLSTPLQWHDVDKDVFIEWVMALIPTLPRICHVTLNLSDCVSEWAVLLDLMFACFRERKPIHHPSSISMSIVDAFLADLNFFRHIAVRRFSLVGGGSSDDDVYTPPKGSPVVFDHLRTLSVSLDPGGMQQFGAWLTHQSCYMPHLEELEFSLNEGEEIAAAYKVIAGGLPPSVTILSLYGERNAFYFGGELKKAVIPAICVEHLKLRLDTKSISSCVEDCITWWTGLVSSILASRHAVSPRVLTISYLGPVNSLRIQESLISTIADLDNLIASLPSLRTIYVADADYIITMRDASMVKDVGVLFPKTFSKGLFVF